MARWTVLLHILVVYVVIIVVVWSWRGLVTATGIAFAECELTRSENFLGCAQEVTLAADVCKAETHAATGVLGCISAILW